MTTVISKLSFDAHSSRTSMSSSRTSTSSEHSIHLLNTIPGPLPRCTTTTATPQRLIHVAATLSIHLSNADLPHAFLGRFALFLRGAEVNPRWVDADVVKPIIGGTQRVKDVLSVGREFAIHGEVVEEGIDRLLVSHRCGVYLRISVGAIPSLKKKTDLISAHPNPSLPPVFLPCLTPARQFLTTVIDATSISAKPEDLQDLVWMNEHLKMDIMSDPATLKKTLEEGKVAKLVQGNEEMKKVFVELGLIMMSQDDAVRSSSSSSLARARSKYGH